MSTAQTLTACIALITVGAGSAAQEIARFQTEGERLVLTPYVSWYVDADATLTVDEAWTMYRSESFSPTDDEFLGLGLMSTPVWVAGRIRNDSDQDDLVIEFRNPRIAYIDLYLDDGTDAPLLIRSGTAQPYDERAIDHPMPAFPFRLAPGGETEFLFRLESTGDMRFRLWLWDHPAFTDRAATAYYPEVIGIGMYLILAIIHFLIYIAIRERSFLYLGLFITSWQGYTLSVNGTGHKLLWTDWPWLADRATELSILLMTATFLLFAVSHLESRKQTPRLYRLVQAALLVLAAHVVFTSTHDGIARMYTLRYLSIAILLLLGWIVLYAIARGSRTALYFALSWVGVMALAGTLILFNLYLISARWILGSNLVAFLFLFSIAIWSSQLTIRLWRQTREYRRRLEERIETLSGLLPICANCKKIRDDQGYWNSVETYMGRHTDVDFTHGICPECIESLYGGLRKDNADPESNGG